MPGSIIVGEWEIVSADKKLSASWDCYKSGSPLVEEFDLENKHLDVCSANFRHVSKTSPSLIIAQTYNAAYDCFLPGYLIVPETNVLFAGAGERLLAYSLTEPRRLWEDNTLCGFFSWNRWGDIILMEAELELAAFALSGEKLWSMFVEPPWSYECMDDTISVDIMGDKNSFDLKTGPST